MSYLIEAIIIGGYVLILFIILSLFIKNYILLFFILGFVKHYLGYYLGIHKYYCNNGDACKNNYNKKLLNTDVKYLLNDSILEGVYFLLLIFIVSKNNKINKYLIFLFGIITHIISEKSGLHSFFCNNRCVINSI